jgi:hypothetical protein
MDLADLAHALTKEQMFELCARFYIAQACRQPPAPLTVAYVLDSADIIARSAAINQIPALYDKVIKDYVGGHRRRREGKSVMLLDCLECDLIEAALFQANAADMQRPTRKMHKDDRKELKQNIKTRGKLMLRLPA